MDNKVICAKCVYYKSGMIGGIPYCINPQNVVKHFSHVTGKTIINPQYCSRVNYHGECDKFVEKVPFLRRLKNLLFG